MNIFDRCVNAINPVRGLERMRARSTIKVINSFQNNGHGYGRSGASRVKNALKGFFTMNGGPEKDIDESCNLLIYFSFVYTADILQTSYLISTFLSS